MGLFTKPYRAADGDEMGKIGRLGVSVEAGQLRDELSESRLQEADAL